MSAAVTFGSLGDILAVCQIAWSLGKALSGSRGSAKEYQDLKKDLDCFAQVLMQVVALWQDRIATPEMIELGHVTLRIVNDCGLLIQEVSSRLASKYERSLGEGRPHNVFVDGYRKIEWLGREKEKVLMLQEKLRTCTGRLAILVAAAAQRSARVDNTTLLNRSSQIEEILSRQQSMAEEQLLHTIGSEIIIREQGTQLAIIGEQITTQEHTGWLILDKVRSGLATLVELKEMVEIIFQWTLEQRAQRASSMGIRGLDPTFQKPLILEDALGNIVEFPLSLADSWNKFDRLLEVHFSNRPGLEKVGRREYALEEAHSGNEFNRSRPWSMCSMPGLKVNTSMLFYSNSDLGDSCPRCGTVMSVPYGSQVQCTNCNLHFQEITRLAAIVDVLPRLTQVQQSESRAAIDKSNKSNKSNEISIGPFQRVKLLSNSPCPTLSPETKTNMFANRLYEYRNYLMYESCVDPGAHFLATSYEPWKKNGRSIFKPRMQERFIVVPGICPLCNS